MHDNFKTLLQTLHQYKLFPTNATILVAVSGGADSIALLHFLATHQSNLGINLHCASLNHGLRPSATDDVKFVEQLANSLDIPCTTGFADVPKIAESKQLGIEASARLARYTFLADTAKHLNSQYIATGHHADDQSETILMHILRGSGSNGLQGMSMTSALPYHPDLTLVRPLLKMPRAEIDAYCAENDLNPCIDLSNFDTQYLRNEIRHNILPRLRQINPQLDQSLAKLADISSTEQEFMAETYQRYFKNQLIFTERVSIPLKTFQSWHLAMQRYCLLDTLAYFQIEPSFEHINHAIDIAIKGQVASIAEFSGGYRLRLAYDTIYIEPADLALPLEDYIQIEQSYEQLRLPSEIKLNGYLLTLSDKPMAEYDYCLDSPCEAEISLRTRQAGDRFQAKGFGGHHQKLKKWFINRKIPRHVREKIPLLIIDRKIVIVFLPEKSGIGEAFTENETPQCKIYVKVDKLL